MRSGLAMRVAAALILAGLATPVLAAASADAPAPVQAPGGPKSVAALARLLSPAVVNISSSHRIPGGAGVPFPKAPDGSQLQQHFDDLNPNQNEGEDAMAEAESLGSGFIISADGLVVTNNHVIDGADQVEIYLSDGTRWPAKLVGADPKTDIAVLRIDAGHKLPFVSFGDSDTAAVGDWVMAIGNPFGLGGSVTLGIVSARNRNIDSGPYDSFIQTDASINQGNSGGPLFDMNGKVVGINTAIVARGGSSLGIGFAIPGNLAQPIVNQLVEFGETRRGWIGVGIQDVTDDIAASIGRSDTHGAMVTDITAKGPADGILKEGDVILDFDGKPIGAMHDLPREVADTAIGKVVPITVWRDGKLQTVSIKLGRLENKAGKAGKSVEPPSPPAKAEPGGTSLSDLLGFDLSPITASNSKAYDLPHDAKGLVITGVKMGSDAYKKGFLPGLLVTEINQHKVASLAEVQSFVDEARQAGRPAVLLKTVDPAGTDRFIAVRLNN